MTVAAAATGEHLFWTINRAAGIAALLTASASVGPRRGAHDHLGVMSLPTRRDDGDRPRGATK